MSYRVIGRLTPEVDFSAEVRKGNVAVAIVVASIFISIALIIFSTLMPSAATTPSGARASGASAPASTGTA